jgi:hypothetical protein
MSNFSGNWLQMKALLLYDHCFFKEKVTLFEQWPLDWDHLVVFYYLSASEMLPDKRGGI